MSYAHPTLPAMDVDDRPHGWTSDKWATPWNVIAELEAEFGKFDLDPCGEPHTAKAPRYYTIDVDGLSQPWHGRVFVNPPYSNPRPWCERAVKAIDNNEASLVVMVLPAATDTAWFHEVIWPRFELRWWRGRIRFLGWRGTAIRAPRAPSLIAVLRPTPGIVR